MNLAHLQYARAVAREGSFSGAARACRVTQPALSNGIAVLERRLGGRLFERTTRGVTPTALGHRVLPLIENTLRGLDAVVAEARLLTAHRSRPFRVGVTSLINRDLIGRAFEAANLIAPGHGIVLRAASLSDLHLALAEAELDMLLVPAVGAEPDVERAAVGEEPMAFIPGTSGAPIELRDMTSAPLILPTDACGLARYTRKVFAKIDVTFVPYAGQAHDCRVIQDWVELGLGSAMLPRSKVHDQARSRPVHVDDAPLTIGYEACWRASSPVRSEVAHVAAILANRLHASLESISLAAAPSW
jgi:DNA-binding transcriptional LysR family regulator